NPTAPPEISPLSLHDALPISSTRTMMKGKGDFQSATVLEDGQTPPTQGAAGGVWGYAGRNIHFGIREHAMTAILTGMAHHGGVVDRKSTRLNSSHVSISYAVF